MPPRRKKPSNILPMPEPLDEKTRLLCEYLQEMGPPDLSQLVGPGAFARIVGQLREAAIWRDFPAKNAEHRRLARLEMLDAMRDRLIEARPYHPETVAAEETLLREAFVPAETQESAQLGRKTREKNRERGRASVRAREEFAGRAGWRQKAHVTHAALLDSEPDLTPKERAERVRLALRGVVAYRTVYDEITLAKRRALYPAAYGHQPGWSGKP
jgi:hypothetical protein